VRLRPDDPFALYYLGRALEAEGDASGAAQHFVHALEINPDLLEALLSLAIIRATSDRVASCGIPRKPFAWPAVLDSSPAALISWRSTRWQASVRKPAAGPKPPMRPNRHC